MAAPLRAGQHSTGKITLAYTLLNSLVMNVSLYQGASALQAMDRWQETIAENLASSSTPGFRKQDITFAAVEAGLAAGGTAPGLKGTRPVLMPSASGSTNFQPGPMRMTGVKTDVAIDGKGFFEVQLPNGGSAYTRDGEFHLNAQDQLVTKDGFPVQGEAGAIQLDLNNHAELSISATGDVSQGAELKGRLKLTEFTDTRLLTRVSGSYFTARIGDAGVPSAQSGVRQGSLEMANTSTVAEMANLMTAMRTFEASQKMVQINDERVGRTISELGNVNG
jgi:flagellar basal body rod protein FlgG